MRNQSIIILLIILSSCQFPTANTENSSIYTGYDSYEQYNDLNVLNDYFEGVECAKKSERPIFLYFSGHGLGYDTFHNDLIHSRKIRKILNDNFVTIILYTDSRAKLTEIDTIRLREFQFSEKYIDVIKKRKTIGSINATLQIQKYQSNTQPLYVTTTEKGIDLIEPFGYQGRNPRNMYEKLDSALNVWLKQKK